MPHPGVNRLMPHPVEPEIIHFRHARMNGEKRVFASSCLSECLSFFMHITARPQRDKYSQNLVLGASTKNLLRNAKFRSNRAKTLGNLYEDQTLFHTLSTTHAAQQYTRHITEFV